MGIHHVWPNGTADISHWDEWFMDVYGQPSRDRNPYDGQIPMKIDWWPSSKVSLSNFWWTIYQHRNPKWPSFVGKYSTMEHMAYGGTISRVDRQTSEIYKSHAKSWFKPQKMWNPKNVQQVGGLNPSEKYESQLGWLFPIYGKIKNGNQTTNEASVIFDSWNLDLMASMWLSSPQSCPINLPTSFRKKMPETPVLTLHPSAGGFHSHGVYSQIIQFCRCFPYRPTSYWGTTMTSWKPPAAFSRLLQPAWFRLFTSSPKSSWTHIFAQPKFPSTVLLVTRIHYT